MSGLFSVEPENWIKPTIADAATTVSSAPGNIGRSVSRKLAINISAVRGTTSEDALLTVALGTIDQGRQVCICPLAELASSKRPRPGNAVQISGGNGRSWVKASASPASAMTQTGRARSNDGRSPNRIAATSTPHAKLRTITCPKTSARDAPAC